MSIVEYLLNGDEGIALNSATEYLSNIYHTGSGCGSVGKAVSSNLRIESSHRHFYLLSTALKKQKYRKRGRKRVNLKYIFGQICCGKKMF